MSLLETISYLNEAQKICWSAALAGFIFCAMIEMSGGKELDLGFMFLGFPVLAGSVLSLVQIVIFAYTGLVVGVWAWAFLVLPVGFILVGFGMVCANNRRRVGSFLFRHGILMVTVGLVIIFPYSVISLSHQAWHFYFA